MLKTDELSHAELVEVTGRKRVAAQAAQLAKLGVPFVFLGRAVKVARTVAQAHALLPRRSCFSTAAWAPRARATGRATNLNQ